MSCGWRAYILNHCCHQQRQQQHHHNLCSSLQTLAPTMVLTPSLPAYFGLVFLFRVSIACFVCVCHNLIEIVAFSLHCLNYLDLFVSTIVEPILCWKMFLICVNNYVNDFCFYTSYEKLDEKIFF